MTVEESKIQEENQKYWKNMRELDESSCERKRINGFPCSKEICEKFSTFKCLHPEKAEFPAKRM